MQVASDKLFAGSIPEIYDRVLVPMIFEPYARDLAQRVARRNPSNVLEVAAGTGALTRALAEGLPPQARITATDLNPPMLDYAKTRLSDARVTWRQADALALPFDDQCFDTVACQFGAMFFPDKVKGFAEARRVLEPRGQFFFNVWDEIATNEFADTVTRALAEVFPEDPPLFMARTPHGYHDERRIRDELKAAGFVQIEIDAVDARSRATTPQEAAHALCQGTPLRNEIEARDPQRLDDATARAAQRMEEQFGSGAIEGRIRALVFSAQK